MEDKNKLYITRDMDNELWLWNTKPYKNYEEGGFYAFGKDANYLVLDSSLFPEVTWYNSPFEVIQIEIMKVEE